MTITGQVKLINPPQQVTDKFAKREFVLITNEQYPQHIIIQCANERISQLQYVKAGDIITAHINIRGREWTSPQGEVKHFNTIEAWKIEQVKPETTTNEFDLNPANSSLPF